MSNQLTQYVSEYPLTWDVQRIKYLLLDGRDGIRIGPFGSSLKLEDMVDDGYKVYGQENVINKNLEVGKRYLSDDKFEELKQYEVFKDDILITMMGTTGKVIIVPENTKKGIMDSHLIRVRFNRTKVDNRFFVYQIMESIISQHQIKVRSKGSIMEGLNSSIIKSLYLTLPPLEAQKQIADFLDKETRRIDTLISKKQKQIELLQEKRQALITQSVTKGLNPDVKMKDSGVEWIGEIPEHWGVVKIRHLTLVKRGASPRPIDDPIYFDDEGECSWVRIADVTASSKYLETTTQRLSELGSSLSVKLKPGKLFLSIAGSVGKPIITKINCCIHDGFVYFPYFEENNEFLYYIFLSGEPFGGLGKMGTQLNLNTDTVGDIKIPLLTREEQENIVKYLIEETKKVDLIVSKVQKSIDLLKEYRSSLITQAVSGQIDITLK